MTVTLTASYKEFLKPATVDFIEENCIGGDYELTDALEFIEEHGEDNFVSSYDDYIEMGEKCGYDVVDAFVGEFGIQDVGRVEDAYVGRYDSEAEFAEGFFEELYTLPVEIVVDWQATWDSTLRYDYSFCDGYVFNRNY